MKAAQIDRLKYNSSYNPLSTAWNRHFVGIRFYASTLLKKPTPRRKSKISKIMLGEPVSKICRVQKSVCSEFGKLSFL